MSIDNTDTVGLVVEENGDIDCRDIILHFRKLLSTLALLTFPRLELDPILGQWKSTIKLGPALYKELSSQYPELFKLFGERGE